MVLRLVFMLCITVRPNPKPLESLNNLMHDVLICGSFSTGQKTLFL